MTRLLARSLAHGPLRPPCGVIGRRSGGALPASLALTLVLGLAACGPPPRDRSDALPATAAGASPGEPAIARVEFTAFASPVVITAAGVEPARLEAVVASARPFLDQAGKDWYAYGDGELARANAALAAGTSAELGPELAALVARALDLAARSGGRFDPAVGNLVVLWGFDRSERLAATVAPPPDAALRAAHQVSGRYTDVMLNGRRLTATRPVRIDLGGIAKGTVLARLAARLGEAGIGDALVDLGGSSLLALGRRGDRPWRAGLKDPRGSGVFAVLELGPGESLATSGDYERWFRSGGRRYGHVLDPATGRPVQGAVSASVISSDPELADAAATALLVAGPGAAMAVAAAMGVDTALVVAADGRVVATPAMGSRLMGVDGGAAPDRLLLAEEAPTGENAARGGLR